MIKDYNQFRDSLLYVNRDSLNTRRKDLVKITANNIKNIFDGYIKLQIDSMRSFYAGFIVSLNQQKENIKNNIGAIQKNEFNDALDDYRDLMDSLSDMFQEKFGALADTISYFAGDSLEGCKDSLFDYTWDRIDDQYDENELAGINKTSGKVEHEPANEIDISLTYDSHYSYRGRDDGIHEYAIAPSVQYQHKSGFGAFIDLEFLSKSPGNPDGVDGGISWQFDISDAFGIQLLYTHFLFTDSSKEERASLNNNFEAIFNLETKYYNTNLTLDLDFGGGVREGSITWYNSLPVTLSEHILKGKLTFEPNLSFTIGEQNLFLIAKRKLKPGDIKVKKSSSTFGIMEYEVGLPLTLETKYLIVKPVFYLIIPVNVLDLSTKSSFGDFSVEITVPFGF